MVNYASEDVYPERGQRVEGPLQISDKEICPAYPDTGKGQPVGAWASYLASRQSRITSHVILSTVNCELSTIHSIHRDSAQELRIKVGRFLGHHFAGCGDFHHLLDVAGVQQERTLRPPPVHSFHLPFSFPFVHQVAPPRH